MDDDITATSRDARAVGSQRSWCAPGALLLVVGLGLGALTSCGSGHATSTDPQEVVPVHADYYAEARGVRVGIRVGFEDAREVVEARMVTGDGSVDVGLYPLDGTDPEPPPETLSLGAGDQVLLEGMVFVPCLGESRAPVFEVDSEADGSRRADRFTVANPSGYDRAVAESCDRPPTMYVRGSSATPAGEYELRVEFVNPGPDPMTVTSERVDDGTSSWQESTVVVPAGEIVPMTVHGHGPPNCAVTPPWESGHVRVDGDVITPEDGYAGWC